MNKAENIPAGFVPAKHIARTATLAVVVLAASVFIARDAPAVAWLLIPAFWIFANFFEWTVHRFPMHRPLVPRMMYRNHAQIHHNAFTEDHMAMQNARELWLIMMPWYTIVLLLVAVSPVAIMAAVIGGLPLAGIFYIGALSYFLFYEVVHALYHVAPERLARFGIGSADADGGVNGSGEGDGEGKGKGKGRGLFARMRAHHARHHSLRRMAHVNFNVTVPLADIVFGTRERVDQRANVHATTGGRPLAANTAGDADAGDTHVDIAASTIGRKAI